MITKREEHGLLYAADSNIYAVGGFDGKECLKKSERYSSLLKKWEPISPLNIGRRSLSVVSSLDGMYAIGGYDGN